MSTAQKKVITISRQLASGGAYIGHLIAQKTGYRYVEREVLHRAARELGVDIRDVAGQDEKKSGFVESLMKSFVFGTPEAVYIPPARRPVYDEELYEAECRIIRKIAERSDIVLVGHAGFSVLAGQPHAFHLYIHAPKEFRVSRLSAFHSLNREAALAEIDESDQRREKYLRSRTGKEWHDARNYHLCLDASILRFEAAADMIVNLVHEAKQR
ncbi:MAG: cytidylate kinase-like family protein [Nitrospiraceae bacterium]|nr:cytidylate kinase-like family protein [Nitrospiraceae bacterium]